MTEEIPDFTIVLLTSEINKLKIKIKELKKNLYVEKYPLVYYEAMLHDYESSLSKLK